MADNPTMTPATTSYADQDPNQVAPPTPPPAGSGGIVNAAQQAAANVAPPTQPNAAPPTPPTAPTTSVPANSQTGIMHAILKHATGGDVYYTDANGQRKLAPQSSGTLGKTLIAATLAGLLAPDKYRDTPYGPVRDYNATGAGAVEAGQAKVNEMRNRPQKLSEEEQARGLFTLQSNANLVKTMAASALQKHETLAAQIESSKPLLNDIDFYESNLQPGQDSARHGQHLSYEDAQKQMTGNYTKWVAMPDGTESVLNRDTGQIEEHPTYSLVNPRAMITLSPETAAIFAQTNPQYKDLDKIIGGTAKVPLSLAVAAQHEVSTAHLLQKFDDEISAKLGIDKTNVMTAIQKNRQLIPAMNAARDQIAAGGSLYRTLDAIRGTKDGAVLLDAMGISREQAETYVKDEYNAETSAAALAKEGGMGPKAPAAQDQVNRLVEDGIKNNPDLSEQDKKSLLSDVPEPDENNVIHMNQSQVDKVVGRLDTITTANKARAQKELEATGGPALVDALGTGHIAPDRISYILGRHPQLIEQVLAKYPDFDSSKAASYGQTYAEYTGKGKIAVQIQSGGVALKHLRELFDLNTDASHIPGTPAYTAYQNKADTLSTELAKFYGDATIPAIASIKSTLASTLPGNREAAIRTQAKSMGDKLDEFGQQWHNAAPSPAYQAPMPGISLEAKQNRGFLDPDYKTILALPKGWQQGRSQMMTDPNMAIAYVKAAGGDPTKAQSLANDNGWILK